MAKEYPLIVDHFDRGNKLLHNVNEVVDFIIRHGQYGDVTVTFEDKFLIDTCGIYLNKIVDMKYPEKLLEVSCLNSKMF